MSGYGDEKSRATIHVAGHHFEVRGWPQRTFLATKVYSVGQWKFAMNANGHYFSNMVRSGRSGYYSLQHGHALVILKGLMQLGAIKDKGLIARLVKAEEERQRKRHLGYAAKNALDGAADVGVKLTSGQIAQLRKIIRQGRK